MTSPHDTTALIWRLTDGKPGHTKQTAALAEALVRQAGMTVVDIAVQPSRVWWLRTLRAHFPMRPSAATPRLVIGAGHGTHAALIAAGRATGAPTVVVMKPSVPISWFDLALIPEHDGAGPAANIVTTVGALSRAPTAPTHDSRRGLIMIGGPSRHFAWNDADVASEATRLAQTFPNVAWTLTTSRRTPATFVAAVGSSSDLTVLPFDRTPPGWLEQQLAASKFAWVTPDSVSMVYESLTAGCATGLFTLKAIASSKVAASILALTQTRSVIPGVPMPGDPRLDAPVTPLDEANRCAKVIVARFLA